MTQRSEPSTPSQDSGPASLPSASEQATQRLVRDVAALEVDPAPPARAVEGDDSD